MLKTSTIGRTVFALSALIATLPFGFEHGRALAHDSYPSRQIRITLGFGPGTAPDIALRVFAEKLSSKFGKPVIVEGVTGAAGNIAAQRVASSEPSGYELLFASNSTIVISPSFYKVMQYNPITDLRPISTLFSHPNVLVVSNRLGVRGVQELIVKAHSNPREVTAASAGTGTTQHLAVEMLSAMAAVKIAHVPYRGGMNLLQDLISGEVSMTFAVPTNVMKQVESGELTALAVTSAKRSRFLPALPTMEESGIPGFEISVWWGLMAPIGTPDDVVRKLHEATVDILALPEVRKRFDDMSLETQASSPEELAQTIAAEAPKWATLIGRIGINRD